MVRSHALAATALILAAVASPVWSQSPPPPQTDGAIEELKAGSYLWAPDIAPKGPVTVIVSLATQKAYAYRNGVPIGVSTVSTGAPGHETPTGIFVILQKAVVHKSNKYSDAPMPFMQRLTWDGIAMHAGKLPGYPASHGCIRLPAAFAKLLFGITKLGLTVVITDDPLAPEIVRSPGLLDPAAVDGHVADQSYRWQPAKAPKGPVTIVVSGRDRRIVVLRNGVEIGSGDIAIDGPVTRTEAFTMSSMDAEGAHWLRLPLPGQTLGTAAQMTLAERARGHFPDGLRAAILSVLQPGTTLLVTRDSIRSAGTGTRLTVITADAK
ncbi:L,D-transpeptidase [Sphingomonas sp.]|uniref:L,D-transpeptidase n=1 Tax=Sphingomonas sp. TaxID=28214 RepID=UPI0025D7B7CD|nr:L,D-transpeptidase [Sphingomonas sp.]